MARSERFDAALVRARSAYEQAHLLAGARGIVVAVGLLLLAFALHRTTRETWFVAGLLAAALAIAGWRGGTWRRGSLAGVLAGLPVFIAPAIYFLVTQHGSCVHCQMEPSLTCMLVCFGTSSAVGALVGHVATRDGSPRQFAFAAVASALLTGLLGCGTTGYGGALGIVAGIVAGSLTGWAVATRTAHA
jgi:hypothetical protein